MGKIRLSDFWAINGKYLPLLTGKLPEITDNFGKDTNNFCCNYCRPWDLCRLPVLVP